MSLSATRCFTYDALTLRVSCADDRLAWLEEFLAPSFTVAPSGEAACDIVVDVDDRAFDDLLRRGPHASGASLDCFVLDNSVVRLPLWIEERTHRVVYDARNGVFHSAAADGTWSRILTRPLPRIARVPLMRVVREFAMAAAYATGRLILHAAAVTLGDIGLVVAGPKHAGKTSLLTHLLRHAGSQYVSNDRVVVDLAPATPTMHGMPTLLSVRYPTWELFPALRERFLEHRYHDRNSLSEVPLDGNRPLQLPPDQSSSMTPAQYCALLGVDARASGPLHAVLFPEVADTISGLSVRPLAHQEFTERLTGALFGSGSGGRISDLFALAVHRSGTDRARRVALCVELATRIRGFHCVMGRDAFRSGFPLEQIIRDAAPALVRDV